MKRSPETPFVFDMFRLLNEAKVPYCVLRDYEDLPWDTGGHDIDLLVDSGSLDRAFDIIQEATRLHAGHLVVYYRRSALITRLCGKESAWWGVAIDVFPLMEYMGIEPGRLHFSWVSSAEARKFVDVATEVIAAVKALGPNTTFFKTMPKVI